MPDKVHYDNAFSRKLAPQFDLDKRDQIMQLRAEDESEGQEFSGFCKYKRIEKPFPHILIDWLEKFKPGLRKNLTTGDKLVQAMNEHLLHENLPGVLNCAEPLFPLYQRNGWTQFLRRHGSYFMIFNYKKKLTKQEMEKLYQETLLDW